MGFSPSHFTFRFRHGSHEKALFLAARADKEEDDMAFATYGKIGVKHCCCRRTTSDAKAWRWFQSHVAKVAMPSSNLGFFLNLRTICRRRASLDEVG